MLVEALSEKFDCEEKSGWIAVRKKGGLNVGGFRTSRIAKIVRGVELQVTIGASEPGRSNGLNAQIASILENKGFTVGSESSTSGSSSIDREYPTCSIVGIDSAQLILILEEVLSEAERLATIYSSAEPSPVTPSQYDYSLADDIYQQMEQFVDGGAIADAFRRMLRLGVQLEELEMESQITGWKKDVRFYTKDDRKWPFAYIINKNSLLFYLRSPAVSSGRYDFTSLQRLIPGLEINNSGEWKVQVRTEKDADLVYEHVLLPWCL